MNIDEIRSSIEQEKDRLDTESKLEEFRLKYAGRKGLLAQLTATIPTLPAEHRADFGKKVNELKNLISTVIEEAHKRFSRAAAKGPVLLGADISMPGIHQAVGGLHPLTQGIQQICDIFIAMGFMVVDGPEIETEYNNFTGLNIPLDHPSREAFDTFYLKSDRHKLLRSQTSPVQIRVMKSSQPPLAVVAPGRVYRPDAVDASHSFMFHQIEGFIVDKGIRFSDLKGTLEYFAKEVFGRDIAMRFRPHFFPFTEPSAEVDISCIICKGKGCPVCGRKGWLEILGAGMIHPRVFANVGYDPKKYTGFAFGMGVERIMMLKHGITDIRLFFENDMRFLRQF